MIYTAARSAALQFNTWRANFGNLAGSGTSLSATVPEPAASVMLLTGVIAMLFRPRARPLVTSAQQFRLSRIK